MDSIREPELFVTDKNGDRWYYHSVRFGMGRLSIGLLFSVAGVVAGVKLKIEVVVWLSAIVGLLMAGTLWQLFDNYCKLLREKDYRERDRMEAQMLKPSDADVFTQHPHGAVAGDGTI